MRNKRNIIIVFLLGVSLFIGIGYATITDILNVNGSSEYITGVADVDEAVKFSGFSNVSHCKVSLDSTGDTATMDVIFSADHADAQGICTATATFTISNGSAENITFANPGNITCTNTLFKITTDWSESKDVLSGKKENITVTVTANVTDISTIQSGTFVIQLPPVISSTAD